MKNKYISFVSIVLLMLIIAGCGSDRPQTVVNTPDNPEHLQETITPAKTQQYLHTPEIINGLVRISDIDKSIVIELKYSTPDNFTGKVVYPFKTCLLREETAQKLSKANKALRLKGYRLKVYDGYRPPFVQKIFWDMVKDERFVANPSKGGSIHSRGGAVDVTMVDNSGNEAQMPSKFDDFTEKASRKNKNISEKAKQDLELLTTAMLGNGFNSLETEWWHFNDKDSDKYQVVDVNPAIFGN